MDIELLRYAGRLHHVGQSAIASHFESLCAPCYVLNKQGSRDKMRQYFIDEKILLGRVKSVVPLDIMMTKFSGKVEITHMFI